MRPGFIGVTGMGLNTASGPGGYQLSPIILLSHGAADRIGDNLRLARGFHDDPIGPMLQIYTTLDEHGLSRFSGQRQMMS
jgi:hypothetical protein